MSSGFVKFIKQFLHDRIYARLLYCFFSFYVFHFFVVGVGDYAAGFHGMSDLLENHSFYFGGGLNPDIPELEIGGNKSGHIAGYVLNLAVSHLNYNSMEKAFLLYGNDSLSGNYPDIKIVINNGKKSHYR